jgi:sugar lactone lactonase YvrE
VTEVECLVAGANRLGESPIWCDRRARLFWVDSREPAVHWLSPGSGASGRIPAPELIGSIGLVESDDRLVAAMESGFFLVDPDQATFTGIAAPVEIPAGHRFNDGRVDRAGRFWAGTMNDQARTPTGTVFRLDGQGTVSPLFNEVIIPNSLGWSPDSRTMYFADTMRQLIYQLPFDFAEGRPGERRVFADLTGQPGRPDGSAVDSDGCLWNAEYAGGRVVRYRPDGRVDRVVAMPVSNPTCCAFGGPELDTLFVTSAAQRLTPEQRAREPLAGALFAVRPGVTGLPESRFRWRGTDLGPGDSATPSSVRQDR